jgi:tetratricopeptide (TPR) repeat protein
MTLSSKVAAVFLLAMASVSCGWALPAGQSSALNECQSLRAHGHRPEAQSCYESLVRSGSPYLRAEGYWGSEQYEQANEEFRIAVAQPQSSSIYRVRWGMLLHELFNNAEAVGLFKEALLNDPENAQAYLGLAEVSADGFDSKAAEYAGKALALDPKLVKAHELLAGLALEDGDTQGAIAHADAALALSPDAVDAMAIHAAVEVLAER